MHITEIRIQNFRSIRRLELAIGNTTVFIGPNNAGKTAILEAIRIVLRRRWGRHGTGLTENDFHRPNANVDPRQSAPIRIALIFEEREPREWDEDLLADLEDVANILPDGRNRIGLELTCEWNPENEALDPIWNFLDADYNPQSAPQRSINLSKFFDYISLHWLAALRDASDEFGPRSAYWGRLLRSAQVPRKTEATALEKLAEIDARIVAADPRLAQIAKTIGQATRVAIEQGPGEARLNTLPLSIEEILRRTGVVLRNDASRPWLPLDHHGQGLQSLAVIFMFQAVAKAQMEDKADLSGEPIFAIEEPDAHLHPQAARTLWKYIEQLPGQLLTSTHSPYFVQHVSLRDICIVRLRDGHTSIARIPPYILSSLPWNENVDRLIDTNRGSGLRPISRPGLSGEYVASTSWFDLAFRKKLAKCYKDISQRTDIETFHRECRILPSQEDEDRLAVHGRRSRSEIFFARHWILVEGATEYQLVHAVAQALDVPLDDHGISVIDFQQGDNAGIFPTLADAFEIPWDMILDNDQHLDNCRKQIRKRGFDQHTLDGRVVPLANGKIECQLIADGHEEILRKILDCPSPGNLHRKMNDHKIQYASALSRKIAKDSNLARRMPKPIVDLVLRLKKRIYHE